MEIENTLKVWESCRLRQENLSFIIILQVFLFFFSYCVFNTECPLLEVPLYKSIHTLIGSILIIRKEKGSRGGKEKMEEGKGGG